MADCTEARLLIKPNHSSSTIQSKSDSSNSISISTGIKKGILAFCRPRRLCLKSKAVALILLWCVLVGLIKGVDLSNSFEYVHSTSIHRLLGMYSLTALALVLYPLSLFFIDRCCSCSHFKAVTFSIGILCLSVVITSIALPLNSYTYSKETLHYVFIVSFLIIFTIGLPGFYINVIHLGFEQLMDAPSMNVGIFVHWLTWAIEFGNLISHLFCVLFEVKTELIKPVESFIPLIVLLVLTVLLIFSCYKYKWFSSTPSRDNPYKRIFKVLQFVWRNKQQRQLGSALRSYAIETPSRIDFAKDCYGGPFTTEQVENVKSFFRILFVLLSLGPIFILHLPSSNFMLLVYSRHIGAINGTNSQNATSRWWNVILSSGSLANILTVVILPVYIWIIYSYMRHKIPKILTRLWIAVGLYALSICSLFVIDIVGHVHNANGEQLHCMFTHLNETIFKSLGLNWNLLILPNALMGLAKPLIYSTTFEFISAQSPQAMKGILVGFFFVIQGFFKLISGSILLPFSFQVLWSENNTTVVANCEFGYFLIVSAVGVAGVLIFSTAMTRYKYRQREEQPFQQHVIERVVIEHIEKRSQIEDADNTHYGSVLRPT